MTGYAFHPEARFDIDEIWEYVRADNLDAADRMIAEILAVIGGLVAFPDQGHKPRISPRMLSASLWHVST